MFHRRSHERGQALIIIALAAIGLFAFAALAIDGSRAFSDKRHAQNTADTAVLTAALKYIRTTGSESDKFQAAQQAALDRATSNGYTGNGSTIIVDVDRCDSVIDYGPTGVEINIPGDRDAAGNEMPCDAAPDLADPEAKEYLRVKIISTIPATFGRVIGRPTFTSAVEAVARVEGSTASSLGDSFSGAAMYATSDNASTGSSCFNVTGGANVHTHNSGIYVNCPKDNAVAFASGGGTNSTTFVMDLPSEIPGCAVYNGQAENPGIKCDEADVQEFDEHTFDYVPTMPSTPDCTSVPAETHSGNHFTPGKYSQIRLTANSTIEPGLYCLTGDVTAIGSKTLTQVDGPSGPGPITFVMLANNKDFSTGTSGNFSFSDVSIFTQGANLDVKGTLAASKLRFYSSGDGNVSVAAGGTLSSGNAYFYLDQGDWQMQSGSNGNLKAPPPGDSFGVGGLLVHIPWDNGSAIAINGGSSSYYKGTFLAPNSLITINGEADFELHSQLIGSEFKINGGGKVDIYYVASENFPPPSGASPTIKLTK